MPKSYSPEILKGINQSTGVYAIYSNDSNQFCIGSTTDYSTRFVNHYADSKKLSLATRPLYAELQRVGG